LKIFTYDAFPSQTREALFSKYGIDGLTGYIHEELKLLTDPLLDIRNTLMKSYLSKEKTENLLNHEEYADIYLDVWVQLAALIQQAVNIKGVSFQNPDPAGEPKPTEETTKKRPRSNSQPKNDDDYKPGGKRGKGAPAETNNDRPRRAAQIPRRFLD